MVGKEWSSVSGTLGLIRGTLCLPLSSLRQIFSFPEIQFSYLHKQGK